MRIEVVIGLLLIAGIALPGALSAADGHAWDKATFGMTEKALQEANGEDLRYSKHNALAPEAGGPGVLRVTTYYLVRQQFEDLDRCRVDFTFYQSRLSVVGFWCFGATKDQVESRLREMHGLPTIDRPEMGEIGWRRQGTYVSYNPHTGIFSISDSLRGERALGTLRERPSVAPPPSGESKPGEPSKGD